MIRFIYHNLLGVTFLLSVVLHAGAALLGHAPVEAPKLKPVQHGRASISLRSSVAAGPKPSQAVAALMTRSETKQKPVEKKEESLKLPPKKVDKPAPKPEAKIAAAEKIVPPQPAPEPPKEKPKEQPAKQDSKPAPNPLKEEPKIVSDQVSLPSRGSAGSRGAELDGPAQPYVSNPAPLYPPEALQAGVEGTVELLIKIDAKGRVVSVRVQKSSGVDSLDQSALETVRQWEFEPAQRKGVPVPYEVRAPIVFEIKRRR